MILASSNLLGIAVTDRAMFCAEVSGHGDKATVGRAATFALPEGMTLDQSDAVGTALASFLKQNEFSSSNVVVGVPAKWLIAVEKDVPPAGREQMRALLRMQAERLPLADNGELVYDYAGEHQSNKPSKVLLVAMLRKQLERVEQIMEKAGLKVTAVTPTSLAMAAAVRVNGGGKNQNAPLLLLGRNGAEVVFQRGGSPRSLRHVSVSAVNGHGLPSLAPLGAELRRAVAMTPGGEPSAAGAADELLLFDAIGLAPDQVRELSERLGWKINNGDGLSLLGLKSPPKTSKTGIDENDPRKFGPVVALSLVGANKTVLPLNFIKSRLAPPPVKHFGRKSVWAAVIGSIVILTILALWIDVKFRLQRQLDDLVDQRKSINPEYVDAKAVSDKIDFTHLFIKTRTPVLDCLLEVTNTFHDEEQIWTTNLHIDEDRDSKQPGRVSVRLEGKTVERALAVALAGRLLENPKISNLNGPQISEQPSNSRQAQSGQVSFSIQFVYNGKVSK